MSGYPQRTARVRHEAVGDRMNTRRTHKMPAIASEEAKAKSGARDGSAQLLEAQLRASQIHPVTMVLWRQRHGSAA